MTVLMVAAALLLVPARSARARLRRLGPRPAGKRWPALSIVVWSPLVAGVVGLQVFGFVGGILAGVGTAVAAKRWSVAAKRRRDRTDPLTLAAGWDLLGAGMRAGLPVPVIVRAVADELDGAAHRCLREVADHLTLGADPATGWEPALRNPDTAELARAARRTARTGSALADVAAEIADHARTTVADHAEARVQRAAVWIAAPLGLCFLPAFLCLGVLPVVLGMVHHLAVPW